MNRARRGWLIAVLVTAVVALVASVGVAAATMGRTGFGRFGSPGVAMMAGVGTGAGTTNGGAGQGMMAGRSGTGAGMMGGGAGIMGGRFGLAGDGRPVTSLTAARVRAQAFADELGLRAGEVMQFSNGYYAELVDVSGHGTTEVLVDQNTGAVSVEYGPAMMWNTRYGMHAGATAAGITAGQAVADAQAWLDVQRAGLTAGEAEEFPGYFTLHTLKDGAIVGMMSINASTGAAWYHTWHGTFIAMDAG